MVMSSISVRFQRKRERERANLFIVQGIVAEFKNRIVRLVECLTNECFEYSLTILLLALRLEKKFSIFLLM